MNQDPYQLKTSKEPVAEEQKLVQIKEPAPPMPSSVATDSFQAFLFGAANMQPSKSEPRRFSCGSLAILVILFLPVTFFLVSLIKGWLLK